jgi:HSP20 family molecular chaperone IbpA
MQDIFNGISRRAYEIFESSGYDFGRDLENWLQAERELLHPVPVNITETDSVIELKAEVPGFDEKEIEIGLEPRRLTISGKHEATKEEKKGRSICEETCSDQIFRMVDLPAEIEPEKGGGRHGTNASDGLSSSRAKRGPQFDRQDRETSRFHFQGRLFRARTDRQRTSIARPRLGGDCGALPCAGPPG